MISSVGSYSQGLYTAPMDGVRQGMADAAAAAGDLAEGDLSPDNVVAMIQAEMLVKANAISVRTADQLIGSLLDTLA
jgi:hypothetical protein